MSRDDKGQTEPLRARAEAFLRRPNPFGREQATEFDRIIAQYVTGELGTDPDLPSNLRTLLTLFEGMHSGSGGERDDYVRELLEILNGIDEEMKGQKQVMTAAGDRWKELLPPPQPPHFVERPINDTNVNSCRI